MTTSNLNIALVNTGTERTNMSIAISGNLKDGNQITVSRKGIETLRGVLDMGKTFNAPTDKIEESLTSRLKGFPNGEEVLAYLGTSGTSVTEYVNSAVSALATAKIKEPVGRTKRGDGFKTKQTKFALSTAYKLACRYAEAAEDGKITTEMLLAGYMAAMEVMKDLDADTVVAGALKIAEAKGLDDQGRIKLRGDSSENEDSE